MTSCRLGPCLHAGAAPRTPGKPGARDLPAPTPSQRLRADVRAALERGRTLAEIARASGVPRPNLSAWLHGRRDITMSTADKIHAALSI